MNTEIVIRKVTGDDDIKWCPGCTRNVTEDDDLWRAFWADGDPTAPLCMVCVSMVDERVRVALEVLNLRPEVRLHRADQQSKADDDFQVPF